MDGYGRIDVLVNNAGASRIQAFPEVSTETWDWIMDLNLKGPYFIMQEAARVMIEQKSGCHLVNIASISAWGGMTFSPPYAVAKARSSNHDSHCRGLPGAIRDKSQCGYRRA